jgi:hypothetical protein
VHAGAEISLPVHSYPIGWPQILLDNQPMCDFLNVICAERVTCLKTLCKLSIRKYLYPAISVSISTLPLPTQLKSYLQVKL